MIAKRRAIRKKGDKTKRNKKIMSKSKSEKREKKSRRTKSNNVAPSERN